jgi:hypothetical protein
MLAADNSTIIPAYLEMDRNDRTQPDLSQDYQVSSVGDFNALKRYFSRLSARNEATGKVYCSVILAQSLPFAAVINSSLNALVRDDLGLYQRASDHEAPGEIGWLCYSVRPQDEERLSSLLSELCDEHIGVKWNIIRTSDGFKKWDPADKSRPYALHVEGPSSRLQECRQRLLDWYGSESKSFPDGTKMRLIPPWSNIFAQDNKVKVGTLVARQVALNERYAHATSYEFTTNLLLDKPCPATKLSLRQVLMNIKSSKFPSCSLFNTIDKCYRDPKGVTFTFVPENESDGRMYVAGLIPYLRSIHPWYLDQFTEAAKIRHQSSVWDSTTQQIFSVDELCIANNIYADDDLNCTDEPTQLRPTMNPDIAITVRQVHVSQNTPDIYKDSDSVSTFHPSPANIIGKKRPSTSSTHSRTSTTTSDTLNLTAATPRLADTLNSIILASNVPPLIWPMTSVTGRSPDGSVSKLSDTASRLSAFESRFDSVTQSLTSALQLLQDQAAQQAQAQKDQFALMSQLLTIVMPKAGTATHELLNLDNPVAHNNSVTATAGTQLSASPAPANQPTQEDDSGGSLPSGTAGPG